MVHLSYPHISSYPYHFLSPPCHQSHANHHSHMPAHIFLFTPPCIYPFLSLDFHTILTTTFILTFVQLSCFVPTNPFTPAWALLSTSLLKMKSLKPTPDGRPLSYDPSSFASNHSTHLGVLSTAWWIPSSSVPPIRMIRRRFLKGVCGILPKKCHVALSPLRRAA